MTTIFTRPADGSGPARRILTPEFDLDVDASPDGTRIAYTSVRPYSTSGVYVADADGGNETFLHPGEGPDWSPDGTRVLVRSSGALYVVDSDGSHPTQLPEPEGHDFAYIEVVEMGIPRRRSVSLHLAWWNGMRRRLRDEPRRDERDAPNDSTATAFHTSVDFDWDSTGGRACLHRLSMRFSSIASAASIGAPRPGWDAIALLGDRVSFL